MFRMKEVYRSDSDAVNKLFNDIFTGFYPDSRIWEKTTGVLGKTNGCVSNWYDARNDDDAGTTVIRFALPGVPSDKVDVEIKEIDGVNKLVVHVDKFDGYIGPNSLPYGATFRLDSKVDVDSIEAVLEHGILVITLKYQQDEGPKTKKVTVK